jgi:hypothetical protein
VDAFAASKFDPDNDPDRPVVGSVIEFKGAKWRVGKVGHVTTRVIVEAALKGQDWEPPLDPGEGYARCLTKSHTTRPAVLWLVWCNPEPE